MHAIVAASRGDLVWAGWFIIFAGILDMLDGRIARFTRTGSKFGAELDSLVDAISFGVAPGFIVYQIYFADTQWSWTLSFVYVTAVVVRLARFNVEQGGEAKRYFHGLPSPAAGMFLASFYPFSQTPLFQEYLADLPWGRMTGVGVVLLGILLVSHVPYAKVPRIGLKTPRGLATTAFVLACLFAAVTIPRYYFFISLFLYILYGLAKSVLLGLLDRLPGGDPLLDDEDEDETAGRDEVRVLDYGDLGPRSGTDAPGAGRDEPQEDQA
jgi:CDP-diacylglycerol--serine O-phosphatidyltransferase